MVAVGHREGRRAREAKGSHQQALDELETKQELHRRNPGIVPLRDIEKLEVRTDATQGMVSAATASQEAAQLRVSTVIPAERASAEAALAQAEVDLEKTIVRAGVSGHVEQFFLRVGDVVNPLMRPAGVLIPAGAGQQSLQAGFGQIEAQIGVQNDRSNRIAPWNHPHGGYEHTGLHAGQFRGGERLIDARQITAKHFVFEPRRGPAVTPGSIINAAQTTTHCVQRTFSRVAPRGRYFALHAPHPRLPSFIQDPRIQRTARAAQPETE
jgi:biotin carboxyl carrier protein